MDWIICYSDGTTYSSRDGSWRQAPSRDVQIVLFQDAELGWTIRHGGRGGSQCDFFRLEADSIVGMDTLGMVDHVVHQLGIVKQGRMLSQPDWDWLLAKAMRLQRELRDGSTEYRLR